MILKSITEFTVTERVYQLAEQINCSTSKSVPDRHVEFPNLSTSGIVTICSKPHTTRQACRFGTERMQPKFVAHTPLDQSSLCHLRCFAHTTRGVTLLAVFPAQAEYS